MTDASLGSRHHGGKRRHGLGWVPWVALLALLALAAIAFLVVRNVNDAGDRAGVDITNDRVGGATESGIGTGGNGAADQIGAAGSGSQTGNGGQSGIFASNGTDLLAQAEARRLNTLNGSTVQATGVIVRSVVADEGFWVGNANGSGAQVFVHLSPQARGAAGESPFRVQQGQRVTFSGKVTPVPSNVSTLGVDSTEGAGQLRAEGYYIEATSLGRS